MGKVQVLESNWSIHPEYGEEFGANLVQAPDTTYQIDSCTVLSEVPNPDSLTVDELLDILEEDTPSLVFVNLRAVDEAGHLAAQGKKDCDYDIYTEAIRRADRAVERIWNYISQEDSTYIDRTTLIVTTDHGRHDLPADTTGLDFTSHGGICHGCRHVMCLVVGPDTPSDSVVTQRTYQVDIAPTIMELLGGDGGIARYAEGQVLSEAISGYNEEGRLIQSDPACDVQDTLVVFVWSDNSSGRNQIWCRNSTDNGATFSDSVQISNSPVAAIQPDVAIDNNGVHVVWLDFQLGDPEVETDYDSWHLFYKRDSDFDNNWEEDSLTFVDLGWNIMEESYFDTLGNVVIDTAWGVWEPSILAEAGGSMITVSVQPTKVGAIISTDGGDSWDGAIVDDETQFPVNLNGCRLGYNAAVTWCAQSDSYKNWEVYYAKSSNDVGQSWPIFERLSWGSSYSIQPTIDSNANQRAYVAWADNWSGEFKLLFRKSSNSGQSWSDSTTVPLPPFGSEVAWQPDIVWDRTTYYDAHLIWVGYNEGEGRLYYNLYDGTDWDDPDTASVPPPDGSVFKPDFSIDDDGNMFVVWTDVTDSTSIVKWDQDPSN